MSKIPAFMSGRRLEHGMVVESGDLELQSGNIAMTSGNIGITSGNITLTSGIVTASNFKASNAEIADPGDGSAIPVTISGVVPLTVGAGVETNTLAIPTFLGQRLVICLDVVGGGSRAITAASAINVAGNTVMTFGTARDCIELVAIQLAGVLAWEVTWNNAVALS
jgi:hypothetical protein